MLLTDTNGREADTYSFATSQGLRRNSFSSASSSFCVSAIRLAASSRSLLSVLSCSSSCVICRLSAAVTPVEAVDFATDGVMLDTTEGVPLRPRAGAAGSHAVTEGTGVAFFD